MGEVYRATDTRLGRTVAIKVLPDVMTSPARRARFEREARAIAGLSHPNICAIHDVGSQDGTEYLVMEYLEGETLADRIARGPLPMTLLLRYGVQIAEALQQAHRAGIVHRDLKPGNVMLTGSGAKLLDFGLARIARADVTNSDQANLPTEVAPLTVEGTIVGTLQYMSPEQIAGQTVDARSDIFALGVILYEMATGRRPFNGTSRSAVIASILSSDPDPLRSLQPSTPPALERIIAAALEKSPADRWQTAQDVARQLRWLLDSPSGEQPVAGPRRRAVLPFIVGGLVLLSIVAAYAGWRAWQARGAQSAQSGVIHLELASPPDIESVSNLDIDGYAMSPDGKTLAYVGTAGGVQSMYLRDLSSNAVRKVEGSETAIGPFWSPDSAWIGFSGRGKLWKTRRAGDTPPEALCDVAATGAMASWGLHEILFSDAPPGRNSIYRIPDTGGTPVAVTRPTADQWRHTWPLVLPDGRHFVYQSSAARAMNRALVLATMDGKTRGVLLMNVSQARSIGADRLAYVRDGQLLARRYDISSGTLVGPETRVADQVSYFYPTAQGDFHAIPSGAVLYRTNTSINRLSVVDRGGRETKLLDDQSGRFFDVALSPDGKKAAVSVFSRSTGLGDIWLYDLARGLRDRFTSDAGMEFSPMWSNDGRSLFYGSTQGGTVPHVVRRALDGGPVETITAPGAFRAPRSMAPDNDTLLIVDRNPQTKSDIHRLSLRSGKGEAVLTSEFTEAHPAVSPDGKWLAYTSDATRSFEVYVQRFDGSGGRVRVSSNGGWGARWSRDGTELYYTGPDRRTIFVARSTSGTWDDASSTPLFVTKADLEDYEVLPDGQSFVLLESTPGPRDDRFHVILNWR